MSENQPDNRSQDPGGDPELPRHVNVRWEVRDASVLGVFLTGVATCVLGALLLFLVHLLFSQEERSLDGRKASGFPLASHPSEELPPEPRLEQLDRIEHIETSNLFHRQLEKEQQLHSYGTTPDEGFVRIPIERAIQHVAKKLPAREQPAQQDHRGNGLVHAGESNSGRMFRGEQH